MTRRAQVLVWSDLLKENHWVDVATNARTEGGLVKHLRAMVAAGEALAWRIRRAQVLVWSDLLEENHWVDVATNARTEGGLVKHLRAMVAAGEALAWRIIRIEREEMGVHDG